MERSVPAPAVVSRHSMRVRASPERTFDALRDTDFNGSWIVRLLFALRSLPSALGRRDVNRRGLGLTLRALEKQGFIVLEELPPTRLVYGLLGQFWTPSGNIQRVTAAGFHAFDDPTFAKAEWSFEIQPSAGGSIVSTQTSVRIGAAAQQRIFRLYWLFVGPFSGLIRLEMLRAIAKRAEAAG